MTATVIPFPIFRTSGEARDIVHVEPSVARDGWDVMLSPATGALSTVEGTYPDFVAADAQARLIAQRRGADYAFWQPGGGAA